MADLCTCDFDPSFTGGLCDTCGLLNPYERDRLQRAYNALCGAENELLLTACDINLVDDLADLRERLGTIAFPGVGHTTEVQG